MKLVFTLLLFTFTSLSAFCEKDSIIYYSKLGRIVDSTSKPQIYDQVKKMTDSVTYLERYVKNKGKWVHEGDDRKLTKINDSTYMIYGKVTSTTDTIYRYVKLIKPGFIIMDFQNKLLISIGYSRLIIPLIKEGKWINYYKSTHNKQSEEDYLENQLISNKRWKETGEENISNVFLFSEVDPEFQGGYNNLLKYLSSSVSFPGKAKRHEEQGTVTVQFVVMEDGSINGVEIIKGATPSLDEESIRVVKSMPPWTPGLTNGKPVRVVMQVPFQYSIPKK